MEKRLNEQTRGLEKEKLADTTLASHCAVSRKTRVQSVRQATVGECNQRLDLLLLANPSLPFGFASSHFPDVFPPSRPEYSGKVTESQIFSVPVSTFAWPRDPVGKSKRDVWMGSPGRATLVPEHPLARSGEHSGSTTRHTLEPAAGAYLIGLIRDSPAFNGTPRRERRARFERTQEKAGRSGPQCDSPLCTG